MTAVANYFYCYGIVKDDAFMEQECERRDDCVYYHIDNMCHYWTNPDYQMFTPPHGVKCPYFIPREKKVKKQDFVSPFD